MSACRDDLRGANRGRFVGGDEFASQGDAVDGSLGCVVVVLEAVIIEISAEG